MKQSNVIFLWIMTFFVFGAPPAFSATNPIFNLCLTGSVVKTYPEYGQAFKNGAELALNHHKHPSLKASR